MSPRLKLGPFLGHVTTRAARLLLRLRGPAARPPAVTSEPLEGPLAGSAGRRVGTLPSWPGSPLTHVGDVELAGGAGVLHGLRVEIPGWPPSLLKVRAAEAPADEGRVAFAFGSCWRADGMGDRTSVWRQLRALAAAGHVDHLLLLGDQLYADLTPLPDRVPSTTATEVALALGPSAPLEERVEPYRAAYERAWESSELQSALAEVPSVSAMDDHEIVDGFGSFAWHREPAGLALLEAGGAAFDEMQGSRNPPPLVPGLRAHAFRRGPAAWLTLDLRTCRDHERGLLVGEAQRAAVEAWLAGEGAGARLLFVALSVPPLHMPRVFHFLRGIGDVRDQWTSAPNEPDRRWLFRTLRDHEDGGRRRVVILSGDVHLATAVRAHDREGRSTWQLTSSPLANRLPALLYPAITALGRRFPVYLGRRPEDDLEARVHRRWHGPNLGVVVGKVEGDLVDLTFEIYRPGRAAQGLPLAWILRD